MQGMKTNDFFLQILLPSKELTKWCKLKITDNTAILKYIDKDQLLHVICGDYSA